MQLFLSQRKSVVRNATKDEVARVLARAGAAIVDGLSLRQAGRDAFPELTAVLSLFGGRHAQADTKASAFTIAALGGLLAMVGDPDREPLRLGGHQEAFALGLSAYCGLAAALVAPQPGRRTVHASLLETVIWLNWKAVPLEPQTGALPSRAGAAAEWQVLRCADGYAALVYQEPDWPRLKIALAEPRLEAGQFATRADRLANAVELAAIVEDVFLTMTRHQIHDLARRHKLPLGPVLSLDDAFFRRAQPGSRHVRKRRRPRWHRSAACRSGWNGGPVVRGEQISIEEAAQ